MQRDQYVLKETGTQDVKNMTKMKMRRDLDMMYVQLCDTKLGVFKMTCKQDIDEDNEIGVKEVRDLQTGRRFI